MSNMSTKPFNDASKMMLVDSNKLYPMSFRVTAKEKALIQTHAGDKSVSAYLRNAALKGKVSRRKSDLPIKIDMAARILGALGQSDVFVNLSTLADSAESGSLPVTEELEDELRSTCALIIAMRNDLIDALGIKVQG